MYLAIRALVKFDISYNGLCAAGAKTLAKALKDNQIMTELNISSNYLGRTEASNYDGEFDMSGIIAISDAIPTMGALTSLDVSNNSLGKYYDSSKSKWISDMTGVKVLAAVIPKCK